MSTTASSQSFDGDASTVPMNSPEAKERVSYIDLTERSTTAGQGQVKKEELPRLPLQSSDR